MPARIRLSRAQIRRLAPPPPRIARKAVLTAPDAILGVPRAKDGKTPRPAPAALLEPGTELCRIEIPEAAVPYSGSRAMGRGRVVTDPKFRAWKERLARYVDAAGLGERATGLPPYPGPVEARVTFFRKAPVKRMIGKRWMTKPDGDNLYKGVPDALSGNVFKKATIDPLTGAKIPACAAPSSPIGRVLENDSRITDAVIRKRYGIRDAVVIVLVAVDPEEVSL